MGDDERLGGDIEEEESGTEAGETGGGLAGAASSKIVKILLWVVGVLLLCAAMFGISWVVAMYVEERRSQREEGILVAPPPPPRTVYELPTFSVSTRDDEPHFAKVSVSLGYEDNIELTLELGQRKTEIRHIINMLLSSKKYEDMATLENKIALAEEIKSHVNVILAKGRVSDVYFTEFVVNF